MAQMDEKVNAEKLKQSIAELQCEIAKQKGTCPVVDFVLSIANVMNFMEFNASIMSDGIDEYQKRIIKLEIQFDAIRKEILKIGERLGEKR